MKNLQEAIKEAIKGIEENDGGPFGAVITDKDGHVIATGHNEVLKTKDPTAHAEINAIRKACQKLNTKDLSNCIIYSTCEPCPMCLSAIIWSNIKVIYYGSTRKDASQIGFKDDDIYEFLKGNNELLKRVEIKSQECKDLLESYTGEIY